MKSRLNRRINAVRKNIVVKKHLLNKLEKIKRDRKGRMSARRIPVRRASIRRRTPVRRTRTRKILPVNSIELPYMKKIRKLNTLSPKTRNNTNLII